MNFLGTRCLVAVQSQSVNEKIVFIAGGGTGGHIYPGVAIAKQIQNSDSKIHVHFIGTHQGLETKIIPKEGFPLHLIQGGKLNMSGQWLVKLKTLIKLPLGFLQSVWLLQKYKPCAVLGVGGYASAPVVLMAALGQRLGIYKGATFIWEPNAHPGLANRWLSKFVKTCFVVFEESKKYLSSKNIMVLGMPVRNEIEQAYYQSHYQANYQAPVIESGNEINLESNKPSPPNSEKVFRILHFGGSQGARAIGQALSDAVLLGGEWLRGVQIVHQSGSLDYQKLKQKYENCKNKNQIELQEFIYDMPKYYQNSDLVICRGGASTIAELAAFGLPAIVIPLPMADGHQEQNARALADVDALLMLLQKDLTPQRLIAEIENLRHHPEQLQKYSRNIKSFFKPKAVEQISRQLLGL